VVDVLDGEVERVLVPLWAAAKLGAAVGQYPLQLDLVLVVERHHAVVQQVGGGDRGLAVVELGKGHLGVGVDEGLLIDPPHPLHRADVEGVLRTAVAGTLALELAVRLVIGPGLLERSDLGFRQHQPVLGALGLERFQPLLHGLEVMTLPDAADPSRRDGQAPPFHRFGHPDLTPGRLLDGDGHHRLLDLGGGAVLQHRLAAAHLSQGQFAAFVVQFLEAIKAVARVAQHLAGLADIAELAGQLQQPNLRADDLLFLCHLRGLRPAGERAAVPARRQGPHPAHRLQPSETNTDCQIKSELEQLPSPADSRI